ncbi:MAG: 50S ribosomal protein L9 [Fusobacteria bacterium]|nr:50S ribosomal protein L9 [Fusobacteriota bacterium]
MKVLLLEDVKNVGKKGEVIEAKDGYAKNFLIKEKVGVEATSEVLKQVAEKKAKIAKHEAKAEAEAKVLFEEIKSKKIIVKVKASENGKIFGAVTHKEISDEVKKQLKYDIDKKKIEIDPIKHLGIYKAELKLYKGIKAELKIEVIAL